MKQTPSDTFYRHTSLILAHRGASHDAPQNTLAAFQLARKMGADGVELDTSLSRDGVPVVIHDLTLDATTNGSGPVRSLDLKALRELDAGSRFSPTFKGERIPTLDEAFEAIGPDLVVNIELKTVSWRADGLEKAAAAVIRRHNAAKRVIVSSFNPFALRRFRTVASEIPLGFLYSPDEPIYLRNGWLLAGFKYEARHPHHAIIDANYVAWAKAHGYRINTWTVDDPARIVALRDLGVDAIISNQPDVALRALER
ncbi:MAG TPA: glycerophosphodiester phosphodiesterase family protein [Aggregatilineales bacterium]|nr:glycerophosphodiester phosphodiesterase family protein [Aggregatilineales bacterium]